MIVLSSPASWCWWALWWRAPWQFSCTAVGLCDGSDLRKIIMYTSLALFIPIQKGSLVVMLLVFWISCSQASRIELSSVLSSCCWFNLSLLTSAQHIPVLSTLDINKSSSAWRHVFFLCAVWEHMLYEIPTSPKRMWLFPWSHTFLFFSVITAPSRSMHLQIFSHVRFRYKCIMTAFRELL